jgi:hypothetical protein
LFQEVAIDNSNYYLTHARQPYYLVVESEDPFTLESTSENTVQEYGQGSQTENAGYAFVGTRVKIDNDHLYDPNQPKYILQSDGNWHKVPQNEPKAFVPPFRAYFRASTASGARALMTRFGGDDQTTGTSHTVIQTIDRDGTQYYYDLNGRLLPGKPQKGVYIMNGKKYVNK